MPTLLLSSRQTEDNQALWRAAIQRDWPVERARGLTLPAGLADDEIVLYVEALFAPAVAARLNLSLVEVSEDWLVRLPERYRKRDVQIATLADARRIDFPRFVKPPNDKSFPAQVYATGSELSDAFEDSMSVLIAEPVAFEAEYRCFVLDRTIRTMSPYLLNGQLARELGFDSPHSERLEATEFANTVLSDAAVELPRAIVLDVGRISGRGWAVVEANAAWGSGIYGCDPDAVLDVLRHAVQRKNV